MSQPDISTSRFLAETEAISGLIPLLAHLQKSARKARSVGLLCDTRMRACLEGEYGINLPVVTTVDGITTMEPARNTIIVISARRERAMLAELEASPESAGQRVILGYLRDVLPFIQARSNMLNQFRPRTWDPSWITRARQSAAETTSLVPSYCIVCTPRSGSHYLCDLLASSGIGTPKEHTKQPLRTLARHARNTSFSISDWHTTMRAFAADKGIFGTKIVSHDLISISRYVPSFLGLFDRVVYLYRRDKVLQALSLSRARHQGIWHIRNETTTSYEPLEYDYRRVMNGYRQLLKQEAELTKIIKASGRPVLVVEYESVVRDPRKAVTTIAEFLGCRIRGTPKSGEQMIRGQEEQRLAQRFVREAGEKGNPVMREFKPDL